MKILISLTYYLPNISGVTIHAHILTKFLAKKHELTVLTSKFTTNLLGREQKNNIKIRRLWAPIKISKGILMPFFPFVSFMEALRSNLIICHLPQIEAVFLSVWGKIFHKPVILIHHTEFGSGSSLDRRFIKLVTYLPHYLSYLLATKIVTHTKDYASHSIFLSKFSNKTEFLLPPIRISKKDPKKIKEIASRIQKRGKIIGFVGRIASEKGIEVLLGTIPILKKKLVDFKIILVGPFKQVVGEKTYDRLKPLFRKYQKWIVLTDRVSRNDLFGYYYNFDCLVLPSINNLEIFGLVQAEAMLCGCPVVATDLPGVRIPIKLTGMGELVPPNNRIALANAILNVCLNREKYLKYFTKAKRIFDIKKYFNFWERISSTDKKGKS